MANQIHPLSPKAQENLKRNAELRDKDNKFIKIQPSEKRVLEFNPEKIEQVEREFNGKKSQGFRYTVIDPNNGSKQENIDGYLTEGHTLLKIQRFGSGKDTRYHVTPAQHQTFPYFFGEIIYKVADIKSLIKYIDITRTGYNYGYCFTEIPKLESQKPEIEPPVPVLFHMVTNPISSLISFSENCQRLISYLSDSIWIDYFNMIYVQPNSDNLIGCPFDWIEPHHITVPHVCELGMS